MTERKPPGWMVDLSLVAIAMIWGSTFVLVKRALADVSTLLFLALRFVAATAALAFVFRKQLRAAQFVPALRGGVIAGVCLFLGYVLQTFGLKYTSASKAGFITGLYIPLVPLFSSLLYRRIPQIAELAGIATAFVGLTLMTVEREVLSLSRGDLLVAGCAVAYSFHILVLGRYAKSANPGALAIVQIATAAVLSSMTFWWAEPIRIQWSRDLWIALAVTSLLATALGFRGPNLGAALVQPDADRADLFHRAGIRLGDIFRLGRRTPVAPRHHRSRTDSGRNFDGGAEATEES